MAIIFCENNHPEDGYFQGAGAVWRGLCAAGRRGEGTPPYEGTPPPADGTQKRDGGAVSFLWFRCAGHRVPVMTSSEVPGSTVNTPVAASWVKVAAGTVSAPTTVAKAPVAAS